MKKLILFISLLCVLPVMAQEAGLKRIEPANWWVGMKYNQVELLVHGDNLGATTPAVNYPGVNIINIKKSDSPNYLFVTIDIAATTKPGKFPIEFMRDGKIHRRVDYQLLAREKNSAQRQGFSPKDAIYLITPDRFANGNTGNDAMPGMLEQPNRAYKGGRHGGDIAGMEKHLDYIAAMGFTQIWPNPLTENNMEKYSYHGYAATDLYKIDARYGTNEEFKNFVQKAQKKGIGVIQDIVLNHIGSNHWWMKDLPAKDWLNFPAEYKETNHRRTTVQDPYAAPADKELFVSGWFVPTMPDLNQRNPQLANYLIQNSLWWIEYAGLSGIREDTYGYADQEFLSRWAKTIMDEYPNFNIVGEEWSPNPAVVAHWQRGKVNASGHVPHMPSVMDFPIHETLREVLHEEESWDKGWVRLYEMLANDFVYADPSNLVIFPENHDTSRLYSYLNEDVDLFKTAMVYMATMRGIPQFYYGSEVLMTSPRERDDGAVRADMPGGWQGDTKNAFTGKGLTAQERDMQEYVKTLLNWRKKSAVIHHGKLQHFSPGDGFYAYVRYSDNQAVLVVLNKNAQENLLDLQPYQTFIAGKKSARNVLTGKKIALDKPIVMPAKTSLIIELQ
ncbi:glycoside hydrolase family 13 protein [Cellvibrio sp. QJXJ]|uniref:glycoside hydrolase family 13 protein n=1 Tax=Cellvibrio sp. QJXJ TaxID=2964606 RepID=UPI0021C34570|nr:glycoside hydrolase family 13 protein [Cellvibrio sp. QJXJ]UUA70958.1 glycoside hydrolase family 13 protein [Cellvibrio sp. QJXJ]